jgi:hypothetical protein
MRLRSSLMFVTSIAAFATLATPSASEARRRFGGQICTLGSPAVGQPGSVICKNVLTGATTQSIQVGTTVSSAGGIGGSLARFGDRVLVTNQAGGAYLFKEDDGRLTTPLQLDTDGSDSLSGAVSRDGAYVLTSTSLRFFPKGQTRASSTQRLLLGDGSAAQVTLTRHYAYVSEKNGSLEAFRLGHDGNLVAAAAEVSGIPAGVIVGITGYEELVVSPIAHLASNFAKASVPVVSELSQVQLVNTKEAAACWAANDDGQVCVTNPGSMTVSCGRLGSEGFESYTSDAASPAGESAFDLDMRDGLVGVQVVHQGVPSLTTYTRSGGSDFLTFVSEYSVGTTIAAGALLLPPLSH